jgi:predicted transport protein
MDGTSIAIHVDVASDATDDANAEKDVTDTGAYCDGRCHIVVNVLQ